MLSKDIKDVRIAVIGAGALGGAVARGLAKAGFNVTASCPHPDRRPEVKADGVNLISDNAEAARGADVVMFAVKPHLTIGVIEEVRGHIEGKLCVSLAAAVPIEILEKKFPAARWSRVMTSILASVNDAFSGISVSAECSDDDVSFLRESFALIGDAEVTDEKNLDAVSALTGAGVAFFLEIVEAAAMGGIHAGLPKGIAYRGAAAAALGAARLVRESGKAPGDLRDSVCTPGGMTIEGVAEIERSGMRGSFMRAVLNTAEKGKLMAEKIARSVS